MSPTAQGAALELEAAKSDFLRETIAGLSSNPRTLPYKFFYDERGAQLFQQICELPEYYLTRVELEILEKNASAIAALIPDGAALLEFGSGPAKKIRILLDAAPTLAAYVPVDADDPALGDFA